MKLQAYINLSSNYPCRTLNFKHTFKSKEMEAQKTTYLYCEWKKKGLKVCAMIFHDTRATCTQ